MQNIIAQSFSKILPQILLVLAAGSTIATGAVAGVKMMKANASEPTQEIQQVSPLPTGDAVDDSQNAPSPGNKKTTTARTLTTSLGMTATPAPTKTQSAQRPIALVTIPAAGSQTNANLCIITLFGQQYNVASLRNSHPGGDVFVCGADQTATYQSAHGTNVSRMQTYLYSGSTSSGPSGTTGATGSTGSSSFDDDEEEESEEERSRYTEEHEDEKNGEEEHGEDN